MSEWISVLDKLPSHGQPVRSKSSDGREFATEFWDWDGVYRFKLIFTVWDHENVTHWKAHPETEDFI